MDRRVPVLKDKLLTYHSQGRTRKLVLGSQAWKSWLVRASIFRVEYNNCSFILRKERPGNQRGNGYWRAYYSLNSVQKRIYIGPSKALTLERLNEIAAHFSRLVQREPDQKTENNRHISFERHVQPKKQINAANMQITASVGPRQQNRLLRWKMSLPVLHRDVIRRKRLQPLLHQITQYPLALVCAPAGYGKTTMLASWATELGAKGANRNGITASELEFSRSLQAPFSIAWLTLDNDDNDPLTFWRYVLASLKIGAFIETDSIQPLFAKGVNQSALICLINILGEIQKDTVLILDNYQAIHSSAIHEALLFLIEHQPPRFHLVFVTRSTPPFALARWRAYHQVLEIGIPHLQFTLEETSLFLNGLRDLALSAAEIQALQGESEGWIVGLQLLAQGIYQSGALTSENEAEILSHIFAYLQEELLASLARPVLTFVLHTSILDRLTAPLCDILVEEHNAHEILHSSDRCNLFLFLLDTSRQEYRYQSLFAKAIRFHIQHTMPELLPLLHLKASFWYEEHGMLKEAIEHAWAASKEERVAALLMRYAESTEPWTFAELASLRRWLGSLSSDMIEKHLLLSLLQLWVLRGNFFTIPHKSAELETLVEDTKAAKQLLARLKLEEIPPHLHGISMFLQAMKLYPQGDFKGVRKKLLQALDFLPHTYMTLRYLAAYRLLDRYVLNGNLALIERAQQTLVTIRQTADNRTDQLQAMSALGEIYRMRGQLHQAHGFCAHALQQDGQHSSPGHIPCLFLLTQSTIELEWNDLEGAQDKLGYIMEYIQHSRNIELHGRLCWLLFELKLAQDDTTGALAILDEIESFYPDRLPLLSNGHYLTIRRSMVEAHRTQLLLMQGDLERANQWRYSYTLHPEAPFVLRFMIYTTLAQVALANQEPALALQALSELLRIEAQIPDLSWLLHLYILQALALEAQGQHSQASLCIEHTLALGQAEGYIRTFLKTSTLFAPLLDSLLHRLLDRLSLEENRPPITLPLPAPAYIHTLLAENKHYLTISTLLQDQYTSETQVQKQVLQPTQPQVGAPALSMSRRENDVLALLARGFSDKEIARELTLAPSTVNAHLKRIYSKLQVHSRAQAIYQARLLRLFDL
ncbi:hypothetical protein EPA93_17455 [Ktedonosporobacter rubrisoli]|uniref:HTH luxR-type domain-containing protein n=1 Tax=Ktedonosporobacter rubrisoli TaxID=2509675 RepID=A0A4P6JQI5_KTERU|nr:LuxR C-terminal-related transcriptional regulator [Ktedonosporobacter rubrisoli]QBD77679.1 hypothetical protein EPA93_17455 [Ktedonosporobacter rubrisoli]